MMRTCIDPATTFQLLMGHHEHGMAASGANIIAMPTPRGIAHIDGSPRANMGGQSRVCLLLQESN